MGTRSEALIRAQKKQKAKDPAKQRYWSYKSYAKKFITEMATTDDLKLLTELIDKRND
jgi:hypothetical protein